MNAADILVRIGNGEDLHTEFKERPIHADDLAASLVAFANTDGGQVIFGVSSKGRIVGVKDADSLTRSVDAVAFNNCEPPITVVQEIVRDQSGATFVVVNVPKGDQRPYHANRGVHYVRTTSGRRQASRSELLRLFQSAGSFFYDEMPVLQARKGDLAERAIAQLLEDVQAQGVDVADLAPERLLRNWRLTRAVNDEERPTVAGVLFLARNPQRHLPCAYVSALRIPGSDISLEPTDQKRIEGALVETLEDTMRFLNLNLLRPHRIESLEPEVRPELPVAALREALVNALAHRDYAVPAPVRVIVFDDRVEVRTPGGLPNSVALEALRSGVHVLRNPAIYNVFLKLGFVTDAGSGIPRVIRLVCTATGREPELRMEGGEFVVAIPRNNRNAPQ